MEFIIEQPQLSAYLLTILLFVGIGIGFMIGFLAREK